MTERLKEQQPRPKFVCVVTSTMYKNWKPTESRTETESHHPENVRGDLALRTCLATLSAGYQLVAIDGGSSDEFKTYAAEQGILLRASTRKGMSPERQEGFQIASQLKNVKYIVWTEPEKVDLIQHVPQLVQPLFEKKKKIIVPARDTEGFQSLPEYQALSELESNRILNELLVFAGLLTQDQWQDSFFGPRVFVNHKRILHLFLSQFRFEQRETLPKLDALLDKETRSYMNAQFFPVIRALAAGVAVGTEVIPYRHPQEQTANESSSDADVVKTFIKKRTRQKRTVLTLSRHMVDSLSKDKQKRKRSRISV